MVGSPCRRARMGAPPAISAIEGRKPPLWSLHSCRRAFEILTLKRYPNCSRVKPVQRFKSPGTAGPSPPICRWNPSYALEAN
jgi:hypothetical protein